MEVTLILKYTLLDLQLKSKLLGTTEISGTESSLFLQVESPSVTHFPSFPKPRKLITCKYVNAAQIELLL